MKVAYVSDTFARRARFGLSRYSHELFAGLRAAGIDAVPVSSVSEFASDPPAWLAASGFHRLPLARRYLATLWAFAGAPDLSRWLPDCDIVHSVDLDYPVATRKPWVATFHDIGPLTHREYFGEARPWLLRRYIDRASRRADAVICVSQATADELRRFANFGDRLSIVPEGVDEAFFAPPAQDCLAGLDLPPTHTPFFLFAGSMNPRKNLVRVLRAFASIADKIPHHIVLTGAFGWSTSELARELAESPVAARIWRPGFVSDAQLHALYACAAGLAFPSLFEGFGLPVLEAMASGCPVVTSSLSSLPEVAGDAALLVDPNEQDEIAAALLRLASDAGLASALRARGLARARAFPWSRCVGRTVEIYRKLL